MSVLATRVTTASMTALLALALTSAPAQAAAVLDPGRIVESASELDGRVVEFEGEAIGDILRSDAERVWVNILGDDGVAIGVWARTEDADAISVLGDYTHEGDRVHIEGVLQAACDRHGGDLDIHADTVDIRAAGTVIDHEADTGVGVAGVVLLALAGVLARAYRTRRLRAGEGR